MKKSQGYKDYREQIDKLNEASLQTFYTLMLNKTMFVVRQISKELQEANTSGFIKKNEKLALGKEEEALVFPSIPKKWKNNQVLLNNFTSLELELFNFITHAKDLLHRLFQSLDTQIDSQFITHLQNIEAAKHHSTQIFHDTLVDAADQLDAEGFDEEWKNNLSETLKGLRTFANEVSNKIELLERDIFDNFKTGQYSDHRSVSLRAKKLVEYILQQEFVEQVEAATTETMDWFTVEIKDAHELIGQTITLLSMIKNDSGKATDMPQLAESISIFSAHLQNADKNKLRMLNQIKERTNALADKFSLNAITRRSTVFKKFIR